MITYADKHAEVYDLLYADKPYAHEADFLAALMRAHAGPDWEIRRILDVACGTANHALAFAALGFEVFGVDASEAMLAVARQKVVPTAGRVRLKCQDMRSLQLGPEDGFPFDAAVCLFDSIGHVVDDQAVAATLASIHKHLVPDGVVAIEFWHAPALVNGFQPHRVRRISTSKGEMWRISESELDLTHQLAKVRYRFIELSKDGTYESATETVSVKFFGAAEMAGLLMRAGFKPLVFHDGYSGSTSIGPTSIHVLVVASRR